MTKTICIKEIPNIFSVGDEVSIGHWDKLVEVKNWCPLWGSDYIWKKSNQLLFQSKDRFTNESLLMNIIGNFHIKDYFKLK